MDLFCQGGEIFLGGAKSPWLRAGYGHGVVLNERLASLGGELSAERRRVRSYRRRMLGGSTWFPAWGWTTLEIAGGESARSGEETARSGGETARDYSAGTSVIHFPIFFQCILAASQITSKPRSIGQIKWCVNNARTK